MFLDRVGGHARANILYDPSHLVPQALDYLAFIDIYRDRIKMFHVKDTELNPDGRVGVYDGCRSWVEWAGRFRSLGDGRVDSSVIFSKMAVNDFPGWAVLEWECCLKHPEEEALFIADRIIRVPGKAFDDFADGGSGEATNRRLLGLDQSHDDRGAHRTGHDRRRAGCFRRSHVPHRRTLGRITTT